MPHKLSHIQESVREKTIHGVFLEVSDVGTLILGDSGIGKSEIALELLDRGHSLIADDSIIVSDENGILFGRSHDLVKELLEIRGLGIINVRSVFGSSAVKDVHRIDMCIELIKFDEYSEVDRLAPAVSFRDILGVPVPRFVVPVSRSRNMSVIVETAVRLHLSKDDRDKVMPKLLRDHSELLKNS